MDKCENFEVVAKHTIVLRKCVLIPNTQLPYLLHFNTDLLENTVFKTYLHFTKEKHNRLSSKISLKRHCLGSENGMVPPK